MAQYKYRVTKKGKIVILVALLGIASFCFYTIRYFMNSTDSAYYDDIDHKKTVLSQWDQKHLPKEALIEIINIMEEWHEADKDGNIVKRLETHIKAEDIRTNFRDKDEIGTSDGGTITVYDEQLKELYYQAVSLLVDIVTNNYRYSDEQIELLYKEYQDLIFELNSQIIQNQGITN